MKGLLVFLATVATATAAGGYEPGLRVKFDLGIIPGFNFFFNVPKSVSEAVKDGWTRTRRPAGPLRQLTMYCPADKVLCAMYDDTEYVAGVQIAVAKEQFSNNAFDMIKQGFTSWNTAVKDQCKKFWTLQQYFVDEEFLKISKEERLATRDSSRLLQAGGVWLTGTDKQLMKIPSKESDIVEKTIFTEQACVPWMGRHYYYNMTETTECTPEQLYPWFPLTQNEELIATGFIVFGELEHRSGDRDWFERPNTTAVKFIVPRGPQCMYDLADSPKALTMHIYYINQPWLVFCL